MGKMMLWLLAPLLTGCALELASNNTEQANFVTFIDEAGSKQFSLTQPSAQRPPLGLSDSQSDFWQKQQQQSLQAQLELTLAREHYCQQGYLILTQTSWSIRGECNDAASDRDLKKFINKVSSLN